MAVRYFQRRERRMPPSGISSGSRKKKKKKKKKKKMENTQARALDLIVSPPYRLSRRRLVTDALTDSSSTGSALHYAAFVALVASLVSASLLVTPAVLFWVLGSAGCGARCFSLEEDLLASINHSVHPCDDFYRHVCGGWESVRKRRHDVPMFKYRRYADRQVVSTLLGRTVPRAPKSALDKAAVFLLHCLGQSMHEGTWDMKQFLRQLGLKWPNPSASSRADLLRSMIRASLGVGLPLLWGFHVGRDPVLPARRNALYITLDKRVLTWMKDVLKLAERGRLPLYLRRCAEVVGGAGQSYALMITDVAAIHKELAAQIRDLWDENSPPAYQALNDSELRLAINSELPDDSQLWYDDALVNLQPRLYEAFNRDQLMGDDARRKRLKLWLGAYAVWTVTPFASRFLFFSLLDDIGKRPGVRVSYVVRACVKSVDLVMPLVVWKIQTDTVPDVTPAFTALHSVRESMRALVAAYGPSTAARVLPATRFMSVNALNMSVSWPVLDAIYSFLPVKADGSYFRVLCSAATTTVRFFTRSLRQPKSNVYHVAGVAPLRTYRLLVARELVVKDFLLRPPLTEDRHPPAVLAAVLGTTIAQQIFALLSILFFYNDHFEPVAPADLGPELIAIKAQLARYRLLLANRTSELGTLRVSEIRLLTTLSLAATAASHAASVLEARRPGTAWLGATTGHGGDATFGGVPRDKLFFLANCFPSCGHSGRERMMQACPDRFYVPNHLPHKFHQARGTLLQIWEVYVERGEDVQLY
ncbi:uncharacterized protein LOC142558330 [Dermacentor variabilis]|uniref:uncharacterized protein LOC142558330 n=1 Tax=Dermacentor variabilis TaxID=34621 RepID=UPI003F5B240F